MRKIHIGIVLTSLIALGGYGFMHAYMKAHDKIGKELVSSVYVIVEEQKRVNGTYPARLEEGKTKVWGIFPGPRVTYRFDGMNCNIYYYQWPLGPHNLFDCRTKEWFIEE